MVGLRVVVTESSSVTVGLKFGHVTVIALRDALLERMRLYVFQCNVTVGECVRLCTDVVEADKARSERVNVATIVVVATIVCVADACERVLVSVVY
jgi:hypothetical protein